ncbi:MAG: hypothetical protein HOQ30_19090 [Gemmatimonadaceae bacterium]|nr:hypothetical protein [Gemmatimonadaceae bacterium]NUR36105.1 hypothetical protein [Gemmatimonadaceae bacterium]
MRTIFFFAFCVSLATVSPLGAQQPDTTRKPTSPADSARQRQVRDSLKAVQDSLALMKQIEAAQAAPAQAPQGQPQPTGGAAGATNPRLLPDFSAVGDFVGDLSPKGTTQEDGTRFSVREVELAVQAVVDPYLRGDVFLGISDLEGLSIEQAYLTTTSIPDLELRLGRYLMPFGKQNTTHRHDLHTIEYPYVIQRFLSSDGLKGTGVWVDKVFAPFGFYQELQATAVDRLGERVDSLAPAEPANKRLGGIGFSARVRNYWDLTQAANVELSFSGMTGKREQPLDETYAGILQASGVDANAALARQSTIGADFTFRWRPLQQGLYKSFILQGEVMRQLNGRSPEIPTVSGPATGYAGPRYAGPTRDFTGAYGFARWQITARGFLGARYDWVQDPLQNGRTFAAGSGYLEWYPSEFSKFAAAYERHSKLDALGQDRILLQATFSLGPHKPHPF